MDSADRSALPPRWLGAVLVAAVLAHNVSQARRGILPEALWLCHPFALVLGIGVLFRNVRVAAVGALFHVGMGVVGYALELITSRTTTVTSLVEHTLAFALALWVGLRAGLPRGTLRSALAGYVTLVLAARWITPAELNVNLAFGAWGPMLAVYPKPWMSHAGNFLSAIAFLGTAAVGLRRIGRNRRR